MSPRPTAGHVLAWLLLAAAAPLALAQADRYGIGLRLRAFERRLAEVGDAARRAAAFAELAEAVQAFFGLDMRAVAERVDAADRALAGRAFTPAERWARSLQLRLGARLVDAGRARLDAELSQLFPTGDDGGEGGAPDGAQLVVRLPGEVAAQRFAIASLPQALELRLEGVAVGDHEVQVTVEARDGAPLAASRLALSVARDLDPRLEAVRRAADAAAEVAPPSIESRTLVALHRLLLVLPRRRPYETTLPGDALLREAERVAAALQAGGDDARLYRQGHDGSFHLRVPVGRGEVATRFFAPAVPDGERRPLVVALHGAGGSENLFFDGYGDGLCVRLAAERGWFVASPRNVMGRVDVVGLVDALAARYAIDPGRVFVVGHSMGAMAAVGVASRHPERLRAVAPVAGGGRVRASEALARLPFFVAAGERDFGLAGARRLGRELERAGAAVTFREYDDVEHLAVMQVALPDVFAFFDRHAR